MSVANLVNVSEILNLNSPVTVDQVEALRNALMGQQAGEVRQALTELAPKLESSEASQAMFARAGVANYLLARHKAADELLSKVETDGVALYYHAQSLI